MVVALSQASTSCHAFFFFSLSVSLSLCLSLLSFFLVFTFLAVQVYEHNRLKGRSVDGEAESLAYFILTLDNPKLQNDLLLTAVPPELLRSEPITFVLQVMSAVRENNWIRFFKLVKQATMLQVKYRTSNHSRLAFLRNSRLRSFSCRASFRFVVNHVALVLFVLFVCLLVILPSATGLLHSPQWCVYIDALCSLTQTENGLQRSEGRQTGSSNMGFD